MRYIIILQVSNRLVLFSVSQFFRNFLQHFSNVLKCSWGGKICELDVFAFSEKTLSARKKPEGARVVRTDRRVFAHVLCIWWYPWYTCDIIYYNDKYLCTTHSQVVLKPLQSQIICCQELLQSPVVLHCMRSFLWLVVFSRFTKHLQIYS